MLQGFANDRKNYVPACWTTAAWGSSAAFSSQADAACLGMHTASSCGSIRWFLTIMIYHSCRFLPYMILCDDIAHRSYIQPGAMPCYMTRYHALTVRHSPARTAECHGPLSDPHECQHWRGSSWLCTSQQVQLQSHHHWICECGQPAWWPGGALPIDESLCHHGEDWGAKRPLPSARLACRSQSRDPAAWCDPRYDLVWLENCHIQVSKLYTLETWTSRSIRLGCRGLESAVVMHYHFFVSLWMGSSNPGKPEQIRNNLSYEKGFHAVCGVCKASQEHLEVICDNLPCSCPTGACQRSAWRLRRVSRCLTTVISYSRRMTVCGG